MSGSKTNGDGEASVIENENQGTSMPTIAADGMYYLE